MPKVNSLEPLLVAELKDLLDAEKQLTKALPRLTREASSPELRSALEDHLTHTRGHINRLTQVFERLGHPAKGTKCLGIQGILEEAEDAIARAKAGATRDAVLIASAQKAEHYEMAAYGTVRTWAEQLGQQEVASILEQILSEEKEADRRLTEVADGLVNASAALQDSEPGRPAEHRAAPPREMRSAEMAADTTPGRQRAGRVPRKRGAGRTMSRARASRRRS